MQYVKTKTRKGEERHGNKVLQYDHEKEPRDSKICRTTMQGMWRCNLRKKRDTYKTCNDRRLGFTSAECCDPRQK